MAVEKESLHKKRRRFKQLLNDDDPTNDVKATKKVKRLTERIDAGEDRPNETFAQRTRRLQKKQRTMGKSNFRKERIKKLKSDADMLGEKTKIKGSNRPELLERGEIHQTLGPNDKPKKKNMKRPASNRPFVY